MAYATCHEVRSRLIMHAIKTYQGIIVIIGISILVSIAGAYWNDLLSRTSFADWSDDSQYYNARALSLIHTGSLGEEQALFRRPPGYPWFLAFVYAFHESIFAAWAAQMLLFCGVLFLLWHISKRFLEGSHALLPPLFLALYWGFHVHVFSIGSEMLSVFLLLHVVLLLFWYGDALRVRYLIYAGFAAGLLALTKPVFLYATPFLLGWILYRNMSVKTFMHAGVCFGIVCAMVGGWALRTYILFGEAQTERIGHVVYTRALYGTLSWKEIGLHLAASVTGNYTVDQFSPGYGAVSVPRRLGVKRIATYAELRNQGLTPALAEQQMLREGISLIKKHPLKFMAGTTPLLIDLNTLENFSGFPITPMFAGTREYIPAWQKVAVLLLLHAGWFFLLGICAAGCLKLMRDVSRRSLFMPLLFLILFFNGLHAFIIIPAEPRFLVPVLPFYFLCFTVGIKGFLTCVKKIYSVEVS